MPNKTEEYLALACKTADSFSRQWEHWAEFLITAARLYKYSYPDQLMIYAQRPDATACAEYDVLPFYAQSVQALGKGGSIHVEHDACHVFVECALHVDGRTVSVPLLNEKQLVARSTAEAAGKRCDPYRDAETDRVPQKEQKNSRRCLPVSGRQRRRMGRNSVRF